MAPNGVKYSAAAAQRARSFTELLDPSDLMPGHTISDLYSLRHLSLQGGIPESPSWLRSQAWKVLLGYLPPEKKEWQATLDKRRREYYQFLSDLLPEDGPKATALPGDLSERDSLLDQIYKDLARSRKNSFAFYQSEVKPSSGCPLAPLPQNEDPHSDPNSDPHSLPTRRGADGRTVKRLGQRQALLWRLAEVNADFATSIGYGGSLELRVESHRVSASATQPMPNGNQGEGTSAMAKGKRREQLHPGSPNPTSMNESSDAVDESESFLPQEPGHLSPVEAPMSPPIYLSPPSPGSTSATLAKQAFTDEDGSSDPGQATHDQATPRPGESYGQQREHPPVQIVDRNWHSLLRILYIYALLNPSVGYIQGMNEALFVLFYTFGTAGPFSTGEQATDPTEAEAGDTTQGLASPSRRDYDKDDLVEGPCVHAEADAFWCFSALIGEVRELYEFEGIDHALAGLRISNVRPNAEGSLSSSGMAGALKKLSLRLKWLDLELWKDLRNFNLDPRQPYYSFRWLACLVSTELSLPSVQRVWDALLSEQELATSASSGTAKIEFLIDICCALLINVRGRLPHQGEGGEDAEDGFSHGMHLLQSYPDDDIGPILEMAILFRQRRLASDLTGDGPPLEDDEEVTRSPQTLGNVRSRAANAWRGWANTAQQLRSPGNPETANDESGSQTGKVSWFGTVGRTFSGGSQASADHSRENPNNELNLAVGTPQRAPVTRAFQRYAEALQSSDAAANLSKASTNLTAKAMASFGGSREPSPAPEGGVQPASPFNAARMPSFGSVGTGFFKKVRSTSSSNRTVGASSSPRTPDMTRWSRDTMPDFPLPNVVDSPPGRMEYNEHHFRNSMSFTRRFASTASPTASDAQSEGGSSMSSFPLPSLRAAAKLGILPRQKESPGSVRAVGPKPLLLTGSARPPREGSSSSSSYQSVDEPSRKVSSGPLAAGTGPNSRATSQTGGSSIAGSFSGRSSRSPSEHGSSGTPEESPHTTLTGHELSNLPPLPSLSGASARNGLPPSPLIGTTVSPASGPIGLQGNGKDGKVPAGAFAKVRAAAEGRTDGNTPIPSSLNFGEASSSSNIPLVSSSSIGIRSRANIRKGSSGASTIASRRDSDTDALSSMESRVASSRSSTRGTSVTSQTIGLGMSDLPDLIPRRESSKNWSRPSSKTEAEMGHLESLEKSRYSLREGSRQEEAPLAPGEISATWPAQDDDHLPASACETPTSLSDVRKYTLTDEPARLGGDEALESLRRDYPATFIPDTSTLTSSPKKGRLGRARGASIVRSKRITKQRTGSSSSAATNTSTTSSSKRSTIRDQAGSSQRKGSFRDGLNLDLPKPLMDDMSAPPSPGSAAGQSFSTEELLDKMHTSEASSTSEGLAEISSSSFPNLGIDTRKAQVIYRFSERERANVSTTAESLASFPGELYDPVATTTNPSSRARRDVTADGVSSSARDSQSLDFDLSAYQQEDYEAAYDQGDVYGQDLLRDDMFAASNNVDSFGDARRDHHGVNKGVQVLRDESSSTRGQVALAAIGQALAFPDSDSEVGEDSSSQYL
ncbi:hypothetical protein IE53DRAFT_366478 [Violaceomyces palustris]|uniref:Uncharacterized protein n=1 Tax=Violaceomyces palustris TaxID=1673888 RepID=A0ACD0P558_9BASI|nr:hypothetical protein IE53DRAFT_366478 [Violaceomyces palustris]